MAPPSLIFGGGGIGGTANSFTYTWDTPEKVVELLSVLRRLKLTQIDSAASYPPTNPWNTETTLHRTFDSGLASRSDFVFDSKVQAHVPDPHLNDENISFSVNKTLELLGVDKLHILYAHRPDAVTPLEQTAAAFDRQFKAGKFDKLGLSNFTYESLKEYFDICEAKGYVKPSVIQDMYNPLCREFDKTIIPLIRKHGGKFYAYSPLAGGFLTGKVTKAIDSGNEGALERTRWRGESSHRMYPPRFDNPAMHEAIRQLQKACDNASPPITPTEATLRWLAHHSALGEGDGIILGASKIHQLESNIREAQGGPLPQALLEIIDGLWEIAGGQKIDSGKL